MLRPTIVLMVAALYPFAGSATEARLGTSRDGPDVSRCLPKVEMAAYLDRAWNEIPVVLAELANGNGSILYASRRGSWTLVENRADGRACVQASGTHLRMDGRPGRDGTHRS